MRHPLASTVLIVHLVASGAAANAVPPPSTDPAATGRRLYEEGRTIDGAPLVGTTAGGVELVGKSAACASCHRRSGSGAFEGGNLVPPVTGPALFGPPDVPARVPRMAPGGKYVDFRHLSRPPYDHASLARALADGRDSAGTKLSPLMPRYRLSAADLASLEAYLRGLSTRPSPGVDEATIRVATVLAPGASAAARRTMLDVLGPCIAERLPGRAPGSRRGVVVAWEPTGDPATWPAWLAARMREQAVFALVGGAGGADWAPVQEFCEATGLPCLFPSVDAPGAREPGRTSFYFSAGTVLEGEVLARRIGADGAARRVVSLRRAGDAAAERGEAALAAGLDARATVVGRSFDAATPEGFRAAIGDSSPDDVLVAWLRPDDLRAFARGRDELPAAREVLASGWLAGTALLDVPRGWRSRLRFAWPFDPPPRLALRMRHNLHPWLAAHGLVVPPDQERVAGDALTACNVFAEAFSRQRGVPTSDKLVEQVEGEGAAMGNASAPEAYHRFDLGPGQRFSSKGAFVVRFSGTDGNVLTPEGGWVVP